jgi:hypothetical protein
LTTLRTLKITRPLLNADEVAAWANDQGLRLVQQPLHVTVASSRGPVDWSAISADQDRLAVEPDRSRTVQVLGSVVALMFSEPSLSRRHAQIIAVGASATYQPYIAISEVRDAPDLAGANPFTGMLVFGSEQWAETDL